MLACFLLTNYLEDIVFRMMSASFCREHLPAGVEVSAVSVNVDLYLSLCLSERFGARSGDDSDCTHTQVSLEKEKVVQFLCHVNRRTNSETWSL